MSGRAIDHVVLAVRDLDSAAAVYERLGFTLTPRAAHDDRMGTSNRLAQFQGQNFIELLEVDRPNHLSPHDFTASPPFFSFGDHNRRAREAREGLSMLVFAGDDAKSDIRNFAATGLPTFAPFEFERQAVLPDGAVATLAFSLAFVQSPEMPKVACFVCENRSQNLFWKPQYQTHANGANHIAAVYLASQNPERDAAFVGKMFRGDIQPIPGGVSVACGPRQELRVLLPEAIVKLDRSFIDAATEMPVLAGIALATSEVREVTPASHANGMFIEWLAL
jgi:catechol 2,3-dioxygenase-like lactoylglutathione lyase family enzyme